MVIFGHAHFRGIDFMNGWMADVGNRKMLTDVTFSGSDGLLGNGFLKNAENQETADGCVTEQLNTLRDTQ
jgi:hypothetical protein